MSKICTTAIPPSSDLCCIFNIVCLPRVMFEILSKRLLHQPHSLYSFMLWTESFGQWTMPLSRPCSEMFIVGCQSSPIPVQKHVMASLTRCYKAFGITLIFVANNIKRASGIGLLLNCWLCGCTFFQTILKEQFVPSLLCLLFMQHFRHNSGSAICK